MNNEFKYDGEPWRQSVEKGLLLKAVAVAHTCLYLFSITAKLFAQTGDVNVNRAVKHHHIVRPTTFQQVFT